MRLILETVKSLFRKTENSIRVSFNQLSKQLSTVSATAKRALRKSEDAFSYADEAWVHADDALSRANDAQDAADRHPFFILNVTSISGSKGTVTGAPIPPLVDGGLYGIVSQVDKPDLNSTAYIKINISTYPIYVRSCDSKTIQSIYEMDTGEMVSRVFRKGMVSLVQYSATKRAFISLNSYLLNFVRMHEIMPGSVTDDRYGPGGFVMMLENKTSRTPSKMVYSKVPKIQSSARSGKWFDIVVGDDGVLSTVNASLKKVSSIPAPDTAEVGQTIRVSAVNANGVPTAWEAVEFIDETAREGVRKLSEEKVVGTAIGEKCAEFAALMNNSENVESFIFFTDPHLAENDNYEEQMRSYLKTLKTYYDATPTSFVVCGGDWIGNSDTQKEACFKLGFIDGQMRSRFDKYYPVLGNHDTNYQGVTEEGASAHSGTLTNETVHNLMFRENGGLYYSFNAQNTKFYVLDSGTDWDNTMTNYRWEQVEWLANQLLQDDAQHIAVVVHMMFSSGNLFGMADYILSVFRAYNDRSSLTIDNGTVFDFSAATGRIEFVISGHAHEDKVMVVNEIPVVVTTNMRNGNTPTFDLCMADYTNRKLHMVRVGSGENRTVELYSKEDALVLLLGMNLTGPKLYNNVKNRSVYLQRKKPEGVTKAVPWSSASTGDYPYNEPYYPIEVPDGAKRAVVTCPDYVKWAVVAWTKGKWDGENAATEDSGWLTVGGGTYEFAAETEVLMILFNDNNGNDMSVESYDSSSFSLAFGK